MTFSRPTTFAIALPQVKNVAVDTNYSRSEYSTLNDNAQLVIRAVVE
jgi:hypothetical protein